MLDESALVEQHFLDATVGRQWDGELHCKVCVANIVQSPKA